MSTATQEAECNLALEQPESDIFYDYASILLGIQMYTYLTFLSAYKSFYNAFLTLVSSTAANWGKSFNVETLPLCT